MTMTRTHCIAFVVIAALLAFTNHARAYVLWGADHQARAEALGKALHEEAKSLPLAAPPASNDATLTIWGHGDANSLAGMSDAQLVQLIVAWKTKNEALKTVEIVTCDARHNQDPAGLDGYAKRVATLLKDNKINVTVKALPQGQNSTDWSILWANSGSGTFCYITSPNQNSIVGTKMFFTDPRTNLNLNTACQSQVKQSAGYSILSGNFANLRHYLNPL
jgi:hypothetical protein